VEFFIKCLIKLVHNRTYARFLERKAIERSKEELYKVLILSLTIILKNTAFIFVKTFIRLTNFEVSIEHVA
jgi:hypothetical protein